MNSAKKAFQLAQLGSRQIILSRAGSRVAPDKLPPSFSKMKAKQERFQIDDGVPVHLKGGSLDKILYQATMALSVIGIGLSLHLFYDLSMPK